MRKSIINLVAASALTFTVAATTVACGGPGKMLKNLDLTSAQQEQVQTLHDSKQQQKKLMKEKRKALKQKRSLLADNYSEDMANEIAEEAGELAKSATLLRIQHQQDMLAILNDEQKEKFKKMMERKAKKGGHDHGRHFDKDE